MGLKQIKALLISICSVVLLIGCLFIFKFHNRSFLLSSPEDWAFFGTYFSGIVSPFLIIINFYLIYNLTKQNLRDSCRPYAQVTVGDYENEIYVKISNLGIGTMIIENLEVQHDEIIKDNLIDHLVDEFPNVSWSDFVIETQGKAIARDQEIFLLHLTFEGKSKSFRTKLRDKLSEMSIKVKYKNIYNEHIDECSRKLSLFARAV